MIEYLKSEDNIYKIINDEVYMFWNNRWIYYTLTVHSAAIARRCFNKISEEEAFLEML